MKTIKIDEQVHKDLAKLKVETNAKTLSEVIDFLICYRNRVIITHLEAIKNEHK